MFYANFPACSHVCFVFRHFFLSVELFELCFPTMTCEVIFYTDSKHNLIFVKNTHLIFFSIFIFFQIYSIIVKRSITFLARTELPYVRGQDNQLARGGSADRRR